MLNQIVLVGKIKEIKGLKETSTGIKFMNLVLEVERSYKNADGIFESDIISCSLWRSLAESFQGTCDVGSVVGVKGRIQSYPYTNEAQEVYYRYEIIAEKVSIISVV